jgi:hypothetical protein
MLRAEVNALLAPVAFDRARVLARRVFVLMVVWFIINKYMGMEGTTAAVMGNVVTVSGAGMLTAMLWTRRIPVAWSHAVMAASSAAAPCS